MLTLSINLPYISRGNTLLPSPTLQNTEVFLTDNHKSVFILSDYDFRRFNSCSNLSTIAFHVKFL